MRKLIFLTFVALGSAIGLFSALGDDGSVKVIMMTIGAVVGTVLGGVVSGLGRRFWNPAIYAADDEFGQGTSASDRDRNYWRDKGYPPFMKPPDAMPDRHMFDPDRQD